MRPGKAEKGHPWANLVRGVVREAAAARGANVRSLTVGTMSRSARRIPAGPPISARWRPSWRPPVRAAAGNDATDKSKSFGRGQCFKAYELLLCNRAPASQRSARLLFNPAARRERERLASRRALYSPPSAMLTLPRTCQFRKLAERGKGSRSIPGRGGARFRTRAEGRSHPKDRDFKDSPLEAAARGERLAFGARAGLNARAYRRR